MERGSKRPSRLARRSTTINYAALDEGDLDVVAPVNFEEIRKALLGVSDGPATGYDSLEPTSLTGARIEETGLRRPVRVPAAANAAEALGIQLPAGEALRVQALAEQLGYGAEVATLDGVGQGPGPRWSMYQWLQYWRAREALVQETQTPKDGQGGGMKRRLSDSSIEDEADSRQVKAGLVAEEDAAGLLAAPGVRRNLSEESKARLLHTMLSLAGTPLQTCMSAPAVARESDLAAKVWPEGEGGRPRVDLFLAMTPAGCFTDFRIDYGGASLWIHVISGRRAFVLIPPTDRNLATYAAWAGGSLQGSVFLGSHVKGVIRVNLGPGDTFLIPGGWAYADAALEYSVAICGNFLHMGNLRLQAEVWRLEGILGVRAQHRYPAFQQVMWYTAVLLAARLRRVSSLSEQQLAERVRPAVEARAAAKTRAAELAAMRTAAKLSPVGRAPAGRLTHKPDDSEDTESRGAGVGRSSRGRPLKINRAVKRYIESEDEVSDDMRPARRGRGEAAATRPRRANAGAKGRGWADEASWESSGETASSASPVRRPIKRRAGRPLVESSDEDSTEQALKHLRAQQAARKAAGTGATGPLQGALPARPSLVVRLPQLPQAEAGTGHVRPSTSGAESLEHGVEAQPPKLRLKTGKRSLEGDKPAGPLKVRLLATGTAARENNLPQVDGAAHTPPASCSGSARTDADESDSGDGPRSRVTGQWSLCLRGASSTSNEGFRLFPEGCSPSSGRGAESAGQSRIERPRAGFCLPQVDGMHESSERSETPVSRGQDGCAGPITDAQAALRAVLNTVPQSAPGANVAPSPAASRERGRAAAGPANETGAVSNGHHDGAHKEIDNSRGGLAVASSEPRSSIGIPVRQAGHVAEDEACRIGAMSKDMQCGTGSAVSVPPDVDVGRMTISKPIIKSDALLGSPDGQDLSPGRAACQEQVPTMMAVPEETGGHTSGATAAQLEDPAHELGARGLRAEEEHETKAEPPSQPSYGCPADGETCGGEQQDAHPPPVLTQWEREGLPVLVLALQRMLGSADGRRAVPAVIPDPELLLDEMEQLMLSLAFPALQSVQLVDFGTVASDSLTPLPSIASLAGRSRGKSQAGSPDDDADLSDRGKGPSGLESLDEEAADSVEVAERKVGRTAAGGRGGGGGAGVGARKGGKLSVKNRLMKKLKIK